MNILNRSLLCVSALVLASVASPSYAAVITFNTQPDRYSPGTVTDSGYMFFQTADGFGTNNNPLWPSNGSAHLMSWTNGGTTSGFRITAANGTVFSIGTFDFGGGYVSGANPVTSLTVSGTGGASSFTRTFLSGTDFTNAQYTRLDLGGASASEVTFTANGPDNRASFDNISISAVPEPSTWAMMVIGFGAVGYAMRRRSSGMRKAARIA